MQVVISLHAKLALERLARHRGVTLAALVESLANEEASRVTSGMNEADFLDFVGE